MVVFAILVRLLGATQTAYIRGIGVFFYIFFPPGRGIVAVPPPRIATADAPDSLAGAAQGAIDRHGLNEILRAGGFEPASTDGPTKEVEGRRNHHLVEAGQQDEKKLHTSRLLFWLREICFVQKPLPFFLQLLGLDLGCAVTGDNDKPMSVPDFLSGSVNDTSQEASKSVSSDRVAQFPGGDEPQFERFIELVVRKKTQNEVFAPNGLTGLPDSLEIRPASDSPAAGEFHGPGVGIRRGLFQPLRRPTSRVKGYLPC